MHSMPPFDERALVLSVAADDQKAFAILFEYYRNRIYTVAFTLTDSKQAAEEIVQDVFVKVWLKRKELPAVEKFKAWLFVIARNMIFSFLRSEAAKAKKQRQAGADLLLSGSPQEALDKLGEKELRHLLLAAVDQLSAQQKQVYLLSKEAGMKQQEIAEQLNISPQTVKKHLQYAMRSIRAYILSKGDLNLALLFLWIVS
ncbi:MAG: RNA polymerase sigma-70 factor [Agriterribacter sp.]